MKFREKLYRFMAGRYGYDKLGIALMITGFAFAFINLFVHSIIIYFLSFAPMAWEIFRSLSRNITARRKENDWFLSVTGKIKSRFSLFGKMWRDRNTYIYKRCPHCKQVMRLPRRKGIHTVDCPSCRTEFRCRVIYEKKTQSKTASV